MEGQECGTVYTASIRLGQGPVVGSCEHNDERLFFLKGGNFLDQLSDC